MPGDGVPRKLVATVISRFTKKNSSSSGTPIGCKEFDKESLKVLQGSRKTRDPQDLGLTGSGQKGARGYAEVLKCIALSSIRNAAHGVDNVFVESGEEAAGGRLRQN